jgi:murein DD-endopeptidase MepM/ murein hydrolase activator NlpD
MGFAAGALTDWWLTRRSPSGQEMLSYDRVIQRDNRGAPGSGDARSNPGGESSATTGGAPGRDAGRKIGATPGDAGLPVAERSLGTSGGRVPSLPTVGEPAPVVRELLLKDLLVPVAGADPVGWKGGFEQGRPGHQHEAVDILAPKGAPVHAVDDGVVAKLFNSKNGGITLYQFDPTRRYCYYYAHLDRYAEGIRDGDAVRRGQVIGYVGTSGNAPPDTPHLHFAIFQLAEGEGWWQGRPVDPYLAYGGDRASQR